MMKVIKKYILSKINKLYFLEVGDIIWARRYTTIEQKERYGKGHNESPYVIIKKDFRNIYALQCTSNSHDNINWNKTYYPLSKMKYNLDKNSYIYMCQINKIKENQYIKKIGHLDNEDLNLIKKNLYIIKHSNFKYKPNIADKNIKFNYSIGDVFTFNNQKYYVYNIDKKYFYTYRISNKVKSNNYLLINNTYYSFLFNYKEKISRKEKITLVETFNTGEIALIKNYQENKIESKIKTLQIGNIINYRSNWFYIYDIKEDDIYTYSISLKNEDTSNMGLIISKGGIYYTYYQKSILSLKKIKNVGFKIKRKSTQEEIELNTKVFNMNKNERKKIKSELLKNKNIINNDFSRFIPMAIINNVNNKNKYLILSKNNDVFELLNINDMSDYFNIKLDNKQNLFKFYRMMPMSEYEDYKKKVQEFMNIVSTF